MAAATLSRVGAALRPGMTGGELDALVRRDTAERGARPAQLGYHGFPAAVCVSVNDVACHGIPRATEVLAPGDLVSVDVTSELGGWHGDTCATFALEPLGPDAAHLLATAERCRAVGIAVLRDGARLGDVGHACGELARREGCSVVTEVGGHGIGRRMHQPPHVHHVGRRGTGRRLRAGVALTVEPILVLGNDASVVLDDDGWTMRTRAGALSAQFEHTVLVTAEGAEVLTRAP